MEFFRTEPEVLKLGGEMRTVKYEVKKDDFKVFVNKSLGKSEIKFKSGDRLRVLFLTHGVFNDFPTKINGFRIYSMALSGYDIIGINSQSYGRKTKRVFPPGTVIWVESQSEGSIENPYFISNSEFIGSNLVSISEIKEM